MIDFSKLSDADRFIMRTALTEYISQRCCVWHEPQMDRENVNKYVQQRYFDADVVFADKKRSEVFNNIKRARELVTYLYGG